MADAKGRVGILDKDARVPVRLISHKSSGINHFRYGTDSKSSDRAPESWKR
jgi:hypothetical protein